MSRIEEVRALHEDWVRYEGAIHGGTGTGLTNTYSYAEGHKEFGEWLIDGFPYLLSEVEKLTEIRDKYAASARTIALWLEKYCDRALTYDEMIADAAMKVAKDVDRLTAQAKTLEAERDAAIQDLKDTNTLGTRCSICSNRLACGRKGVETGYCGVFNWRGLEGSHEQNA